MFPEYDDLPQKIAYIKQFYKTLRGKPIEQCSNEQIVAVYLSLQQRKNKTKQKRGVKCF